MDQFDSLENITLFDCDTAYIYILVYTSDDTTI